MTATVFALWSIATRFAWAIATLALAALLPTHAYAEYAFLQISSSVLSQLIFGVLGNVITAQLARRNAGIERVELARAAAVYGLCIASATYPVLLGLGYFGAMHLDAFGALTVSLLTFAATMASNSNGYLTTERRYVAAIVVGFAQTALYMSLLILMKPTDGAAVAVIVAFGQLFPSALVVLSRWAHSPALTAGIRDIFSWHTKSISVNVSYFPALLLLWYLTNLLTKSSSAEMAAYGLGNQLSNLFLYLPTALAPLLISTISQGQASRPQIYRVAAGFVGLSLLCGGTLLVTGTVLSRWLPATIANSVPVMAVSLAMAGLIAGRAPFAWINQMEHRAASEVTVSLIGALLLTGVLIFPHFGGLELMAIRTLSAGLCLLISLAAFWFRGRPDQLSV